MIRRWAVKGMGAIAAVMLGIQPALALSCLPSGITDSYLKAANSDSSYNVIKGRLRFDQVSLDRRLRKLRNDQRGGSIVVAARLQGQALGAAGFTIPANVQLRLHLQCLGPWCPGASSDQDVIVFARQADDQLIVELDACSGDLHQLTDQTEQAVLSCHSGGECLALNDLILREDARNYAREHLQKE